MMEKEVNSYSVFEIGTAAESLKTSSSENVHNSHGMKKGRRLTTEQTRALEKSFELAKILEAGRKEQLAGALGLHPRQISIWFQNRRAKWKSAQLEKDFCILKQNYGFLQAHYHILLEENKRLQSEIQRSSSILKNAENKKGEEVIGDGQIDFNIVQDEKEECYGVQASMEESCRQEVLLALQVEDCYYNMGDISGIMSVESWTPSFP
eukprot:PITA_22481